MSQDVAEEKNLYTAHPNAFTKMRDALAKELKKAGKEQDAARVKAIRKPSAAAWALNRLATEQPDELRALSDADALVREAQRKGAADEMREASATRREILTRLTTTAAALLVEAGLGASEAVKERIASTLHAASTSDEARDLLNSGTLTKEIEPGGFGDFGDIVRAEPTAQPDRAAEIERARRHLARLQDEVERLEAEAERLDRVATEAEDHADRVRAAAERARDSAAEARKRYEDAEAALTP